MPDPLDSMRAALVQFCKVVGRAPLTQDHDDRLVEIRERIARINAAA